MHFTHSPLQADAISRFTRHFGRSIYFSINGHMRRPFRCLGDDADIAIMRDGFTAIAASMLRVRAAHFH